MAVHLFGAISSPGCANFGLKKAADDGREEFGSAAADFIYYDVDDGLPSLPTVHETLELLVKTQQICGKHGIRLHKFASNSKTLLMSIAAEDRSLNLHNIESVVGSNMNEKALGVEWSMEQDTFHFSSSFKYTPITRRSILSAVSSVCDSFGFLSPVILVGKQVLQDICKDNIDWDSPISDSIITRWKKWRDGMST